MIKQVIEKGFIWRLLLILFVGIIILNSSFSLMLYTKINFPLDPRYGAVNTSVADLKESLIQTTVRIELIFFLFITIGVIIVGIIHSHRIAGPLYGVTLFAKSIRDGDLDRRIIFRDKDVIHGLATTINKVLDRYQRRAGELEHKLMEMEDALRLLASSSKGSGEEGELMNKLKELNHQLTEEIEKIKL